MDGDKFVMLVKFGGALGRDEVNCVLKSESDKSEARFLTAIRAILA